MSLKLLVDKFKRKFNPEITPPYVPRPHEEWGEAVTLKHPSVPCEYMGTMNHIAHTLLTEVTGCEEVKMRTSTYHNLEVTVVGGDPHAIAKLLYWHKPAGITLVGHLNVVVKDLDGCDRFVSFNYVYG